MKNGLPEHFYRRNVLDVAPELLGKTLCRRFPNGDTIKYTITEVEAYNGVTDLACHASKGKTNRTKVMFDEGGLIYVYLIYGMYWMLNIVTGEKDDASAVLIRGLEKIDGPGRVGKILQIDKSFYGENLATSKRIWIENASFHPKYHTLPRVGINYAGEPWVSKLWRFKVKN